MMRRVGLGFLAVFVLATQLFGQELVPPTSEAGWPQWRGPLATGVAPAANPPVEWSETEQVRWKVAIPGHGSASPVVWGDHVFVLTAIPDGEGDRGGPGIFSRLRNRI
ncbi:MAG: PQQ-binding-like beta-propeller repeat protein, partial [Pirellulales bacterium]|nr:PQQ-binding-like beta-propeller repeat protein [Pirellulales bacterium]